MPNKLLGIIELYRLLLPHSKSSITTKSKDTKRTLKFQLSIDPLSIANNTQISKENRTITTQGASNSRPKVETFVLQWSNQHGKKCDKRKGLESDQGTAAPSEKANSGECSGTPLNLEEWCYLVCQCSETCPRKSAHLLSQLAFAGKEASLRGLRPPSKLGPTRLSYSGSTRLSSPPESTIPLLLAPCSWVWFRFERYYWISKEWKYPAPTSLP